MSTEDRTVQLADGRGTAEVMHGDRCVVVSTTPPGEPLILDPGQARRLSRILNRQAYESERHAAPTSDTMPDYPAKVQVQPQTAPREAPR